ncbi:MAG: ThiF family adenylyltransferase [Lachnospiraceae bacterium]|nr:ThiF family adenylyltransferase [Lachnospiraceae bacterium]
MPDTEYQSQLVEDGWDKEELERIQLYASKFSHIPINDYCIYCVIAYLIENNQYVRWQIMDKKFCTEDICILKWLNKDDGLVYTFIDNSKVQNILSVLSAFECGNVRVEGLKTTEELKADDETYHANVIDLAVMGLAENSENNLIPNISDNTKYDESSSRFSSALWFDKMQKKKVLLAGLGGIGSYCAFLLARMKPERLILLDDDIIEPANMSGQLYSCDDLNHYKVEAICTMINKYALYYSVVALREKYTEATGACDIMMCGFDNMKSRSIFFHSWLQHVAAQDAEDKKKCLFIDGRLAAEEFQVLCIRGDDSFNIGRYEKEFLFSDSEADITICSYKQTTFMANMIGSIMVNLFTNFVANEVVEGIRDLPFLTTYSADSMTFKVEH